MAAESLLVVTTCASVASAAEIATHLVSARLAACVNAIANVTSTYRWNDNIEQAQECVLLIKTTGERYEALEAAIRERSSYELPEIVAVPIDRGLPAYLDWITASTGD